MVRPQTLFLPLPSSRLLDLTLSAVKILESGGTHGKNKQEGPQTQGYCHHFINNVTPTKILQNVHIYSFKSSYKPLFINIFFHYQYKQTGDGMAVDGGCRPSAGGVD